MTLDTPQPRPTSPDPLPQERLWGLDVHQLHDRYWAAHGVQVVRVGDGVALVPHAEMYLLTDPRTLVLFPLHEVVDDFNWLKPHVMHLRIRDQRDRTYRERVVTDRDDRFLRFRRVYDGADPRLGRVLLTCDPDIAMMWRKTDEATLGSRNIRRAVHPLDRSVRSVEGGVFDGTSETDRAAFVSRLQQTWRTPDVTVTRAVRVRDGLFADSATQPPAGGATRVIGPVWLGAGRRLPDARAVVGPVVIYDQPGTISTDVGQDIDWSELTTVRGQFPTQTPELAPDEKPRRRPVFQSLKRMFDILFSICAILLTLPVYPFVLAAIWLEDGRPFFFVHQRETLGGRVFGCIKFRSMRKDAEKLKLELARANQADGPQFFIEQDPRLTRVGAFLRKYNLDEFPQFFNVLKGDMSIVGPRPSPRHENQYCPPWREARLSVRPGVTGLWQVSRTRRAGQDFQEWIKYDLQYVENATLWLDVRIIYQTISMIFRKAGHS